ncbi:hypothetical protein ACOMHN_004284 [Nucella lapillus]
MSVPPESDQLLHLPYPGSGQLSQAIKHLGATPSADLQGYQARQTLKRFAQADVDLEPATKRSRKEHKRAAKTSKRGQERQEGQTYGSGMVYKMWETWYCKLDSPVISQVRASYLSAMPRSLRWLLPVRYVTLPQVAHTCPLCHTPSGGSYLSAMPRSLMWVTAAGP